MSANLLDGPSIAKEVLQELRTPLATLASEGRTPRIASVQVGESPASAAYLRGIRRNCESTGIAFDVVQLAETSQANDVLDCLDHLGKDNAITGVMMQFPLPRHLDGRFLQTQIPPGKDLEAITPMCLGRLLLGESRVAPCTALAALRILDHTGVDLKGAECVVVGMSEIVGKPIAILLLDRFATTTICHVETRNLAEHTRNADILIVATGKPHLIDGTMIKPGAIVIDIGYTTVEVTGENGERKTETQGDVVFAEAAEVASWLTPVPGGVGPVTRAMLMRNAVEALLEHPVAARTAREG